jgi:hypothetical protein
MKNHNTTAQSIEKPQHTLISLGVIQNIAIYLKNT